MILPELISTMFVAWLLAIGAQSGAGDEVRIRLPNGFESTGETESFDTHKLYEAIDGAAETYLDFGFRRLRTASFERGSLRVTVSVYDMGQAINAFGIFTKERPEGGKKLAIGAGAVAWDGFQCLMFKGRHYVKVDRTKGVLDTGACREILGFLQNNLPGGNDLPNEIGLLPSEGRIEGTLAFVRKSYLGLSELVASVHAEYLDSGGKAYQLFVIPASQVDTGKLFTSLEKKWNKSTIGKSRMLTRKVPYRGEIGMVLTPKGIVGVACTDEGQDARGLVLPAIEFLAGGNRMSK